MYCLSVYRYVHQFAFHNIVHHIYNSNPQVYLNNAENILQVFQDIHLYQHKLFHQLITCKLMYKIKLYKLASKQILLTCILGYNHSNILSMYQHIYDHIGEFQPWRIHRRCNELVHQSRRSNQILYYKQDDSRCIVHLHIGTFQQDM